MYRISKEFHFSASHQLYHLPADHQCARLHGHNYVLKVELGGTKLDEVGFILDYGQLSFVKNTVDDLDHRHLNDLFDFNPTSENICREMYTRIESFLRDMLGVDDYQRIEWMAVELSETPKTNARYERGLA